MATIIFIDDEHGPIDYYVEAIVQSGHQVTHLDNVEGAFAYLGSGEAADLFVLDVMMPTHGLPELNDAAEGLASGVVLHDKLRARFPHVPIIVLTSISNPEIIARLKTRLGTTVLSKVDTLPFRLAALIDSLTTKRSL